LVVEREAVETIQREIDRLPPDEAYAKADINPGPAYELGRKDGLRLAIMLLEGRT